MSVLVLGIGNILWADEGFGVRAVEAFHRFYAMADGVDVLDGGTQGLYLVHHVAEVDRLLVFDAIDYGLAPGTLKVVRGDDDLSNMLPSCTRSEEMPRSFSNTSVPHAS